MSSRSLPARRKASRPESWPVLWRVSMPAVRDGDHDWIFEETDSEDIARRRCATLRRLGWPVRLERIQQQPLEPAKVGKIEFWRLQHERAKHDVTAH